MDNGGGNNYWQPGAEQDPFAPAVNQNAPNTAQIFPNSPVPDQAVQPAQTPAAQSASIVEQNQAVAPSGITDQEIPYEDPAIDDLEPEMPSFEPIRWSSSSTITYEHSGSWNLILFGVAGLIVGGLVLLAVLQGRIPSFSEFTIMGLVIVTVITILMVSKQPARETNYVLSESGLGIDGAEHPFSEFRAFGVNQEGVLWQLTLIPVKRFGAAITIFINAEQGEQIVDVFGTRLPMEKIETHPIDKITRFMKL